MLPLVGHDSLIWMTDVTPLVKLLEPLGDADELPSNSISAVCQRYLAHIEQGLLVDHLRAINNAERKWFMYSASRVPLKQPGQFIAT
nr:hypothetical protein CFP56_21360 [Quercus suber]